MPAAVDQRVAAKGRTVAPRAEGSGDPVGGQQCTDGYPVSEGLGKGDHIRDDIRLFAREKCSRPSDPGLDFVDDHQETMIITDFSDALQIARSRNDDTALPLNRLDHDARRSAP